MRSHRHTTPQRAAVATTTLSLLILSLLLSACGGESGYFRMEGSFKNFSQGELYVYSTDGGLRRLDTLHVKNGQFTYQVPLDDPATFVIVFPNFSELPVFGESGAVAEIEGDASHLKEIEVKGTKENEQLTAFRLSTSQLTPPEAEKQAERFVEEHPRALASIYMVNKYFLQTPTPNYEKAAKLVETLTAANPDNQQTAQLQKSLSALKSLKVGGRLPKFSAVDIKGKNISSADLYAKVNVVHTWSLWNYDSQNALRKLQKLQKDYGSSQLRIVSFCIDASPKECSKRLDRDSIKWSNVCDGRMWETPALLQLGLYSVPDVIVADSQGKILALNVETKDLEETLKKLLDKR